MNFNFSNIQNSQNTIPAQLAGNQIHEVTFDGCEMRDFAGKQDPSRTFKVLEIKFSNKSGAYTHTIWQPKESDFEDTQSPQGYPQPANALSTLYLLKHLIDAVNPDVADKINKGEIKMDFNPDNWDQVRKFMVEKTEAGKGMTTKIKLIVNNKGEAVFPSFFLNYNRSNEPYMNTNFIGNGIYFTTKESERISNAAKAKPTTHVVEVTNTSDPDFDDEI